MIFTATSPDYATLFDIERRSNPHPFSEKRLRDSFDSQANTTFLIRHNDDIVGFIVVQIVIDTADIVHIVIDQSHQGKGLAKALLTDTLTVLTKQGVTQVFLEVREQNVVARHVYKKCGFHVTGKRKNYYSAPTEDAVLMVCDLTNTINNVEKSV